MKVLALIFSVLSFSAFAGDSSTGCGLGWAVASKNTLVSATTRTITNATFSNQIFGTTSGTSGCARHPIVQKFQESLYFARINSDRLKMEIAQGQGEYVTAYAATFGCNNEGKKQFAELARSLPVGSEIDGDEMVYHTVTKMGSNLKAHCALF